MRQLLHRLLTFLKINTLRKRILLIVVAMSLGSIAIIVQCIYGPLNNLLIQEYIARLEASMNDAAQLTTTVLTNIKQLPVGIYSQSSYIRLLQNGYSYENSTVYNRLITDVSLIVANNRYVSEARLYCIKDNRVIKIGRQSTLQEAYNPTSGEIVPLQKEGQANLFLPLQDARSYSSKRPIFSFAQRITDFPKDQVLGVFVADITSEVLDSLFHESLQYEGETTGLLSQDGQLLYLLSNGNQPTAIAAELIGQLSLSSSGIERYTVSAGEYLTCVRRLDRHGLFAFRFVPMRSLTARSASILRNLLTLYLPFLLVLLALSLLVTTQVIRPIQTLAHHMQRLGKGHMGEHIAPVVGYDEFNLLIYRFNDMTDEIQRLIQVASDLHLAQKTAEFKALQAQINPHFLFNTLQSVQYLATEYNASDIHLIITSLSNILHYCIREESELVPFESEMSMVREYFTIQQIRFISQLSYSEQIDPRANAVLLPKMTLQPLVENCVQHGMKNVEGRFVISLLSSVTPLGYELVIRDNGHGMEPEQLAAIRETLKETNPSALAGVHIGISNCWARLRYWYGDAFTFAIESQPGRGTEIHIQLARKEVERLHEVSHRG